MLALSTAFAASFPVAGAKNKDLKQLKNDMQFSQHDTPFIRNGIVNFPYTYEYYKIQGESYSSTTQSAIFQYPLSSYTLCLNASHYDGKKTVPNDAHYCVGVINRQFSAKVQAHTLKQYQQIQNDEDNSKAPVYAFENLVP